MLSTPEAVRRTSAVCLLAVFGIATRADATNVCIEFLENHLGEAVWESDCIAYMESQPSPALFQQVGTGNQSASMGAGSLLPQEPMNWTADNIATGLGSQNEPYIAIDPDDPDRIFAISKNGESDLISVWKRVTLYQDPLPDPCTQTVLETRSPERVREVLICREFLAARD